MKRIIFTLMLLAGTFAAFAQNRQLERLAGEEGISYVYVSKAMLSMISGQGSNTNINGVNVSDMADKLNSFQVVSASTADAVQRLRSEAGNLSTGNMEVLMQVVEENNRVNFYTLKQGDIITDLLMISDSGDEMTILQIQGRFTSQDIQKIAEATK